MKSIESLYLGGHDDISVKQLSELLKGQVSDSISSLFPDLALVGLGNPSEEGTFVFEKNRCAAFKFKNLSAGEKAAFDLILDIILKRDHYCDSIYCIDEPDAHMHASLQGKLLNELLEIIPSNSQIWIATHSIGILRRAREIWEEKPEEIVFLDFHDRNFEDAVVMQPAKVNRSLWKRILSIAIDDLSELVAPETVVMVEGEPSGEDGGGKRSDFDARCYGRIFQAEYPNVEFVSAGNWLEIDRDSKWIKMTIQKLVSGVRFIRLIDRDARTNGSIKDTEDDGVRVLERRSIENYLLDDEILESLCESKNMPDRTQDLLKAKEDAVAESIKRGNPQDDLKSAAGDIKNATARILYMTQTGMNKNEFMRDVLAPLVKPDMKCYQELKECIFGGVNAESTGD